MAQKTPELLGRRMSGIGARDPALTHLRTGGTPMRMNQNLQHPMLGPALSDLASRWVRILCCIVHASPKRVGTQFRCMEHGVYQTQAAETGKREA
jgi:hypothetical protein